MKRQGQGWFNESYRHSLAAKGLKSGTKYSATMNMLSPKEEKDLHFLGINKESIGHFTHSVVDHLKEGFDLSKKEASHLMHEVRENAPKAWDWIKDEYKKDKDVFHEKGNEVVSKVKESAPHLVEKAKETAKVTYEKGKEAVEHFVEQRKVKKKEIMKRVKALEDTSDAELKTKTIRWRKEEGETFLGSIFGIEPSNPYEVELLRRIQKATLLEREIRQIKRTPVQAVSKEPGFFDYLSGREGDL